MDKMDKLEPLSPEWFDAAFEEMEIPEFAMYASIRICKAYNITGQADPGYIANIINQEFKAEQ